MTCPSCRAENEPSAAACAQCGAALPPAAFVVSVDMKPGTLFASRYEIERPLGRGGMGIVYLARDRTLDEVVAIKLLRPDFASDSGMAHRFKSEIKLARKVRHRNVGAIHDFGEDRGLLYISMEYIEGVDLKQLLKRDGAFAPGEAYELAIQVADGLQAVHDAGIIHRDLKTPNIMRDRRGVARLMDFGIAKQAGVEGTATATGHIVGTPEYMSPEQAQGKKVDFRTDVYALGVVAYEMFSGQVPFRGETPIATILKHLQEPPTLEGPGAPALPAALIPVLRRCLAKHPDARFATAREVGEALRHARQAPAALDAREPGATVVLPPPAPSGSRSKVAAAAVAAVALTAAVVAMAWLRPSPPDVSPSSMPPPPAMPTGDPRVVPSTPPALAAEPPPAASAAMVMAPVERTATRTPPPSAVTAVPTRLVAVTAPTTPPTAAPTEPPAPAAATPLPPAAAEQGEGMLHVVVMPWADVIVNGRVVGTTPLDRIPLEAGNHRVSLRHPTYETVERTILIRAGQTEKLRFDFPNEGTRKP